MHERFGNESLRYAILVGTVFYLPRRFVFCCCAAAGAGLGAVAGLGGLLFPPMIVPRQGVTVRQPRSIGSSTLQSFEHSLCFLRTSLHPQSIGDHFERICLDGGVTASQ
ncbi:MAG: hypothetical protein U5K38_07435 [Woeseiaceae bacterium]|nr:hypothetical protein [Woeseiaceae bacterium]